LAPALFVTLLTSAALAQVDLCKNTDWVDDEGCGCEEYDFNPAWCDEYGELEFDGSSANEACCGCGGGNIITIDGPPTEEPIFPIVLGQKNCVLSPPVEVAPGLTVQNYVDNDEQLFRMRLTYEGTSWIGLSFENDGRPGKPTFAIIGRQDNEESSSVRKYYLNTANPDASGVLGMPQGSQTLENVSFVQEEGKSILTFTKALNEIFDIPEQIVTDQTTWIYAVGLPNNQWAGRHTIAGNFNMALTPCFSHPWEITDPSVNGGLVDENFKDVRTFFGEKRNKFLWIAHGISLGVAWGIIAPLALASAFLKRKGPKWSKIHQFANTTTLLLTCAGILLGVIATYSDDTAAHLQTDHSYYGVGVFGGLLIYCMMLLYFAAKKAQEEKIAAEERARRRAKRVPTRVVKLKKQERDIILGMGDGMEVLSGDSPHNPRYKNKPKHSLYSQPMEAPDLDEYEGEDETRPLEKAGCMEWLSRLLILACIAVAYYTCHTGIDWQIFHYDLDWKFYYWGVGAFGVAMILLLAPFSCCLSDHTGASKFMKQDKVIPLGARDSMAESPARMSPNRPAEQAFFAKAVDESTFYGPDEPDSSTYTYDESMTLNTNNMQYIGDDDEQRSPMRKSWDCDTCCL